MKVILLIASLLVVIQLQAQDLTNAIKSEKEDTMSANKPDTYNTKKELKEIRTLIDNLPVAVAKASVNKKETDLVSVFAIAGQALGFLILLCSWFFQNQRQGDWQDKKDKLREVWDYSTTLETQIDVLEFANNSLGLQSGTPISDHVAYGGTRLHYLNDFGYQIWAYLKNSRKMYNMNTALSTEEDRAAIDSLIADGKAKLAEYGDSITALEPYVWFFRDEQRRAMPFMASVIYKYRDQINIEIERANKKANFLYVVGSIILLTGFSLPAKKDLPEMSWFVFALCFAGVCGIFFAIFKLITAK